MTKIIEAGEIPLDEKVYVKKDWFGWRVVNPNKDPVTGKINWFNTLLGGRKGLVILLVIMFIATCLYFGIQELVNAQAASICAEALKFKINVFGG